MTERDKVQPYYAHYFLEGIYEIMSLERIGCRRRWKIKKWRMRKGNRHCKYDIWVTWRSILAKWQNWRERKIFMHFLLIFKDKLLKTQDWSIKKCKKSGKCRRTPEWMNKGNRELTQTQKGSTWEVVEVINYSWGIYKHYLCLKGWN